MPCLCSLWTYMQCLYWSIDVYIKGGHVYACYAVYACYGCLYRAIIDIYSYVVFADVFYSASCKIHFLLVYSYHILYVIFSLNYTYASVLQNCILLCYITSESAIWGTVFCYLNYFGHSSYYLSLYYFCDSSASSCYSCVLFYISLVLYFWLIELAIIQYLMIPPVLSLLYMYFSFSVQHHLFLPMVSRCCTSLYAIFLT